ncbi:BZIP domain-containing protein [Trichoderma simmonsii]|uniref:BZIP domain-containing protein n=1 Tax=Trichoderma simmonsii TaxID=1491479 RepID=A0A8G0L5J5_9HYPO|nr:BZIP domain-containing protein [Trichoderma simmonsii]
MTSPSDAASQLVGDESNVRKSPVQRKSRQRPNKPISAERRMQNCRAQRAYRQRKRDKLKELEAKVASLEPGYKPGSVPNRTAVTPPATADPLGIEGSPSLQTHATSAAIDSSQSYDLNAWDYNTNVWLDDPTSTSLNIEMMSLPQISSNEDQSTASENNPTESFSALLHNTDTRELSSMAALDVPTSTTAGLSDNTATATSSSSLLSINTSASMYSASRSLTRKDIHIHRPSGKALIRKPQLIRKWFQSLPQSTRRLLAQLAKDGDFSFVDMISSLLLAETSSNNIEVHLFEGSDPEKTESQLSEMRFAISPATSYSPYRNALRIARFSYFAALFTNFSSLGFDFGLFLDERSQSPFCVNRAAEVANTSTVTEDENIPFSLRPVSSQYTISHHPYIDALPFPTLRRRALAALAADPPLLDEDDLCLDLMLHDGLVCWGSAGQNGMDYGTPWDSHSWEAKEWFLRKWKWLIGGQDGELWHSSRWWAAQRGEYISMRD